MRNGRRGTLSILTLIGTLLIAVGCAKSDDAPETEAERSNAAAMPEAPTPPPTLDGKRFIVDMAEKKEGAEQSKDTLTFTNGSFQSLACIPWGFGAATYTATGETEATGFNAVCTSEKEGTMTWTGTIDGDKINGTTVWTKEGQDPITYVWMGEAS